MLSRLSERKVNRIRWLLVIGWFVLIFSLFYDPISPHFTEPHNFSSPFHLPNQLFTAEGCVKVQGECLPEQAYAMRARIW